MERRLAQVVSFVFDPRVVVPVLLTVAFWWGYRNGMASLFLGLLLFIDAGLPFLFYLSLKKSGAIADWEIKRREERMPLYAFVVVAHLGGIGLAVFSKQEVLTSVLLVFWFLAVMFTGVTMLWKVSIHTGVMAALATFLWLELTGWWWLWVLVVLVGWSRVVMRRHTLAQATVGGLLGALGMVAGMRLVGL